MSTPRITGFILAGGLSRRLGQDKPSLRLGCRSLALWVASALAPWVETCWLITNQPQVHLSLGLPLLTDLRPWQGPLGGLETALFYAPTPLVLAAAADAPFPAPSLLAALVAQAGQGVKTAVLCHTSRGMQPFPGIYSLRLLSRLTAFLNEGGRHVIRFLEQSRPLALPAEEVMRLDPQSLSFMNLNTPEDLQAAVRLVQENPQFSLSS